MRTFEGFKRGVNLGGWLSQYDVRDKNHFDSFIIEKDIEKIASLGLDHIRIPVDYELFETEDGTCDEEGFHYLDACVGWCRKNNLNIVLDLHRTFGYTFDPLEEDGDKEIFFHNSAMQERFYTLWKRFAQRYAADSDIMAFELLNEIVSEQVVKEWNDIADHAVKVIREAAPDAYIIIGGVNYNHVSHVADLNPPADDRIVYNFHCYDPHIFTHQRAYWMEGMPDDIVVQYPEKLSKYRELSEGLSVDSQTWLDGELQGADYFDQLFAPALAAAQKNNAPLYCGEYGVIELAPLKDTAAWFRDIHSVFEKHQISRAAWTYKEKDFGITGDHYAPAFEQLIEWL